MKKALKIMAVILAVVLIAFVGLLLIPRNQNFELKNPMRKNKDMPILIAHGGGNREFPDNTLEAFYNAYSVDKNVIMETDVNITKDGVVILSHDTTLDRKTNVTGAIADWNYYDLVKQRVDFGYTNPTDENGNLNGERVHFKTDDGVEKYPTDVEYPEGYTARDEKIFLVTSLEELIVAFPKNRISVEIKQSGELGVKTLKEVLRLLEKYDAFDRVIVASFHEEFYDEFQRLQQSEEVPETFMCSPSYDGVTEFFVLHLFNLDFLFDDGICVFQIPMEEKGFNLATARLINVAHKHNIAVHYWTVNDEKDMRKLIEVGADGITTDYPHLLKEVYDSYK